MNMEKKHNFWLDLSGMHQTNKINSESSHLLAPYEAIINFF